MQLLMSSCVYGRREPREELWLALRDDVLLDLDEEPSWLHCRLRDEPALPSLADAEDDDCDGDPRPVCDDDPSEGAARGDAAAGSASADAAADGGGCAGSGGSGGIRMRGAIITVFGRAPSARCKG